jgi:hypothetical protein
MNFRSLLTASAAALVLVACGSDEPAATTSTVDAELAKFQQQSEDYIEGFDVAEKAGQSFTDAVCEAPSAIKPKVTYTCTAKAEDGAAWTFTLEVTGDKEFTVQNGEPS